MFLLDFIVAGAIVAVGIVATYVLLGSMDAKTAVAAAPKAPSPDKKKAKKNKKSATELKAEREMDAIVAADMAAVSKSKGMSSDSKNSVPVTLDDVRKANSRIQAAAAPAIRVSAATAELNEIVEKEQGFVKVKNENKKKEKAPVVEDFSYEADMDSKLRKFFRQAIGNKKFEVGKSENSTAVNKINIRGKGASKGWGEDQ